MTLSWGPGGMTYSAQEVFGVLRQADEHELELHEIAPRAGLTVGQVRSALRDLCARGLVVRHRVGRRVLFSVNNVLATV